MTLEGQLCATILAVALLSVYHLHAMLTIFHGLAAGIVKIDLVQAYTSRCAASSIPGSGAATTAAPREQKAEAGSEWPPFMLYNTMSRQKELFVPRPGAGNRVTMYCCGVTVYDFSHIGHARVYCCFDVLYRFLRQIGYDVFYVRNFTDIDDKIINRARDTGEDPLLLSQRFIAEFHKDMEALGCLAPAAEPQATQYVPQMVRTIQAIVGKGHAYESGGDVLFAVDSIEGYGRLSGRSLEDNRAGERVAVDERKRNPFDFVLWKAAKPGEPTWDSPWGPGRPGWHIECSTMIRELMGPVIDIHGGGRDLMHPHHDNELVQSQAAADPCDCDQMHNSTDFVRWWVHLGFVNDPWQVQKGRRWGIAVDSEKMSKSLGNFFTIRDVLQQYHPLAVRLFLIGTQYRQPINYTVRSLDEASDRLYYIYQTLLDGEELLVGAGEAGQAAKAASSSQLLAGEGPASAVMEAVKAALLDDLNTPVAISELSAPLKALNDLLHTKAQTLGLLGLWRDVGPSQVLAELRSRALLRVGLKEEDVAIAIQKRAEARQNKDYAAADSVRLEMESCGIQIMDTAAGTTWRPSSPKAPEAAS